MVRASIQAHCLRDMTAVQARAPLTLRSGAFNDVLVLFLVQVTLRTLRFRGLTDKANSSIHPIALIAIEALAPLKVTLAGHVGRQFAQPMRSAAFFLFAWLPNFYMTRDEILKRGEMNFVEISLSKVIN